MKKCLLFLIAIFGLGSGTLNAQTEVFSWQGAAVGADASGAANCAMGAMPDIIKINSTYYMYYIARYSNVNAIYYATSPDLVTWDVQDTIMTASSDTTNRIYDLGGPGVLKLSNGQYRLFYRTSQKSSPPNEPLFHVRSMISADGINFTHEAGVRIENSTYQANSYFKSASHPAVYKDANGNTKAIITGRDTSMNINSPAGLYTASSSDEGLTWSNFQPLYAQCHDPVVILDSNHVYHMYTSLMATGHREVVSTDGITWPTTTDTMLIKKGSLVLNEGTSAYIIADLGAAVKTTGEVIMYSNYKPLGPGAWVDIAYYFQDQASGINQYHRSAQVKVYPNPATDLITIETKESEINTWTIFNMLGESVVVKTNASAKTQLNISGLAPGMYFITDDKKQVFEKVIIGDQK